MDRSSLVLHEDTYYEYFQPYRHPHSDSNSFGGIGLETYGADLKIVCSLETNFVWTVVDGCEDNCLYIAAGLHFVNRVVYLVSTTTHHDFPITFRCRGRPSSLTPLGLKRQVLQLSRYMAKYAPKDFNPS